MIPFLRDLFHAFLFDASAFKRWLLAFVGFLVSVAATVAAFGVDVVIGWTPRERLAHLGVALIGGMLTVVPAPSITKKPDAGT
jgi:hypothetical protein